jgi:hypothetical protein
MITTNGKGIQLSKCPTCGEQGYKLHMDPLDKTSSFYYKHYNEQEVKGKVRTCRNGRSEYEPLYVGEG